MTIASRAPGHLRVAHILPWEGVGGVEHGTLRLIKSLAPGPIQSVAFCVEGGRGVTEHLRAAGVATVHYQAVEPSIHRRTFARATWALARQFRSLEIDVVHCADLLAASYASIAARLAGCGVVCHVRCAYPSVNHRDRLFLKPVQEWLFVSRATQRSFAIKVPESRATVVYDAAVVPELGGCSRTGRELLAELGVPLDARIVGMIARVAPVKDYETLARAVARAAGQIPEIHVVVVGDNETGVYQDHYHAVDAHLRELGIRHKFTFTGHRSDVGILMQAFDVVALVSHSEGLPLVLLEAMSLGKTVIATDVGGIPELVRHGETGMLHPPGDAGALAGSLVRLLNDRELGDRLGMSGQRFVREQFCGASAAAAVSAVYDRVARRSTRVDAV